MTARSMESTRAIQEVFETRFLKRAALAMTPSNPNNVNGFAHMRVGSGAGNIATLKDFLDMKTAFDKANVPIGGRVAIVDPIVAATIANLVTLTSNITDFPLEILRNGFDRDHEFIMNLYGWHIFTSNRLHKGSFGNGTATVADGVANIFMSVADDNTKPMMAAWRRMPSLESERNKDKRRQEYVTSCRYGFGVQRLDTLGVLATSASTY